MSATLPPTFFAPSNACPTAVVAWSATTVATRFTRSTGDVLRAELRERAALFLRVDEEDRAEEAAMPLRFFLLPPRDVPRDDPVFLLDFLLDAPLERDRPREDLVVAIHVLLGQEVNTANTQKPRAWARAESSSEHDVSP
jgi:hypothetical protein